jgi:hypothetical protein
MRLVPVVVGGLFPLSAWLYREHLRRVEVVALALLLAVEPVLFYYSRFMRNDATVAALAFQRDHLLTRDMAVTALLVSDPAQPPVLAMRWIPALAQMFLGLLLPFVLALVAIPLESFIHSARSVLGGIAVGVLRLTAYLLRLLGQAADALARLLVRIYDLLIFLPLALEHGARSALQRTPSTEGNAPNAPPSASPAVKDAPVRRGRQRSGQGKAATGDGDEQAGDGSSEEAEART